MILLSQRDKRWASVPLGFTKNTTIGSHGCLVTSIAMLADVTPIEVNERLKRVNGFAYGNLVIWSKIPQALPQLQFIKRVYGYNNDEVKANLPCIVEVDFDNTPRTDGSHFVLFVGNQKMYDPWTGTIRSTGTYSILKGYAIIKKKIEVIAQPEQAPATQEQPQPAPAPPEPENIPEIQPDNSTANVPVDTVGVSGDTNSDTTLPPVEVDNTARPVGSAPDDDGNSGSVPQADSQIPQKPFSLTPFFDLLLKYLKKLYDFLPDQLTNR